jgi:hypothetical protein
MDPYLEKHWGDIHHRLVQYACDQLQEQLPDPLRARVEERVFLEADSGWSRNVFPDVRVIERGAKSVAPEDSASNEHSTQSGGIAVAEPLILIVPNESLTEGFIEIRDGASGNRVVTVIEVLSPANKAGANGTDEYLRKQREVLSSDISLVEIDLLRSGRRVTAVPFDLIPTSHKTTYHVCVHRGWRGDEFELYPVPLRQRLPKIKIPLRKTDGDIRLDLQALMDQAYRSGRYDDLDYRSDPIPPLEDSDARWADELLRQQSLR